MDSRSATVRCAAAAVNEKPLVDARGGCDVARRRRGGSMRCIAACMWAEDVGLEAIRAGCEKSRPGNRGSTAGILFIEVRGINESISYIHIYCVIYL